VVEVVVVVAVVMVVVVVVVVVVVQLIEKGTKVTQPVEWKQYFFTASLCFAFAFACAFLFSLRCAKRDAVQADEFEAKGMMATSCECRAEEKRVQAFLRSEWSVEPNVDGLQA
jgi:peptidoglycan/LPS O-acetylase OafA/YrhL